MNATVKQLRQILKGVAGAWVHRWDDGEIWVGIGSSGFLCELPEIGLRIERSDRFRLAGMATARAFIVEQK